MRVLVLVGLIGLSWFILLSPTTQSNNNVSLAFQAIYETIPLEQAFSKSKDSVVQIIDSDILEPSNSVVRGTGIIYDGIGHIITSYYSLAGSQNQSVRFSDGSVYEARLIGADPFTDLAVLRIQDLSEGKPIPLPLGNSTELGIGERVAAIGYPFNSSPIFTQGTFSGFADSVPSTIETSSGPLFSVPNMIVTDVPTNQQYSGGPLLDSIGRVIGMNTGLFTRTAEFSSISLGIPSNTITKIVPSLIEAGYYFHPWLGLSGIPITASIANATGLKDPKGILVTDIALEGPADKAGIQPGNITGGVSRERSSFSGDIILAIDNQTITTEEDILAYLEGNKQVGDEVILTIVRDGLTENAAAVLAERPLQ